MATTPFGAMADDLSAAHRTNPLKQTVEQLQKTGTAADSRFHGDGRYGATPNPPVNGPSSPSGQSTGGGARQLLNDPRVRGAGRLLAGLDVVGQTANAVDSIDKGDNVMAGYHMGRAGVSAAAGMGNPLAIAASGGLAVGDQIYNAASGPIATGVDKLAAAAPSADSAGNFTVSNLKQRGQEFDSAWGKGNYAGALGTGMRAMAELPGSVVIDVGRGLAGMATSAPVKNFASGVANPGGDPSAPSPKTATPIASVAPLPFGAPDPNQRVARNIPGASGESLKGAYGAYSPAGTFDKSYTDLGGGIAGKGSGSRGQPNDFTNIGANGQPTAMSQGDSRTPDQIANAARINADTARFVAQRDQERQGDPYQNALRAAAGQIGIPLDQMTPRTMAAAVQMANAQTQAQVQGQGNRLQHDAAMFGHNISAANNRATVSAAMFKAQRDQLNADRTHELAQSTHDLAQQKAGDDRVGEAAKKYAAGPDGKVDPDKERAYLNSTDALLGNAIKAATDRGDHKLAEQLTRQGRAGVDSQIAQQHTARLKSAQIASGAHGWTPWSGTHIRSDDPTDYDIVGEDKGLLWNTTRLKGGSSVPSWNYKGGLNPFAAGTTEFDSIGGHKLRQAQ